MNRHQDGFTLIEISIVLLIVTLLLGYTLAMFPIQQELKQYREAKQEMARIKEAVIGFAQVNGRLPCPALPNTGGSEVVTATGCSEFGGFVPATTLGLSGSFNADRLLLDPWGNPYRYYVTDSDFDGTNADFVTPGEMRKVGLIDSDGDDYIDLDPNLIVCASESSNSDDCSGNDYRVGEPDGNSPHVAYAGAPVVLISTGRNGAQAPASAEEQENGDQRVNADLGIALGPSGNDYLLNDIDTDTVFALPDGQREDFDDLVEWISSNRLFGKMIEAGQLP